MQYQLILITPEKTDLEIPGSIDQESPWQKKGLAYPINKKEEAYLKTVFLRLPAQKAPKVIKKLENSSQVWRFLLTKASEQDLKRSQGQGTWQKKTDSHSLESKKEAQKESSKKGKKQKVKIEDLDEKIDEILGE